MDLVGLVGVLLVGVAALGVHLVAFTGLVRAVAALAEPAGEGWRR